MASAAPSPLTVEQLQTLAADPAAARAALLPVLHCMAAEDEEVRSWGAEVLENLEQPPPDSVSHIAPLTLHAAVPVAGWACKLLGRLGAAAANAEPDLLQALTGHPSEAVREEAANALGKLPLRDANARTALQQVATGSGSPRLKRLAQAALDAAN
jgi:HEAT repeat protein